MKVLAVLWAALVVASGSTLDLAGNTRDPFATPARVRVFLFIRSDCPVSNRYAPELRHIAEVFSGHDVELWLVYADPSETVEHIRRHLVEFGFPGEPLRDPDHALVKRAQATFAPEAAVFDAGGKLVYHGRIDDLWADVGKARPFARIHDLEDAISAVLEGRAVAIGATRAVGCSLADVK
jgi:hypothetical protein